MKINQCDRCGITSKDGMVHSYAFRRAGVEEVLKVGFEVDLCMGCYDLFEGWARVVD